MKQNQQGFSLLSVLVIILVLSAGVLIWQVVRDSQPPVTTTNNAKPQESSDDTESTKRYANQDFGISFEYPADFQLDDSQTSGSFLSLSLKSPDYRAFTDGFGGTEQGISIFISARAIGTVSHNSVESILSGTYSSKESFSEQKSLTIGGLPAVEYTSNYEGPPYRVTQIDTPTVSFRFSLEGRSDGSISDQDIKVYRLIVESFKTGQ